MNLWNFNEGIADVVLDYQGRTEDLARIVAKNRIRGFRLEPGYVTSNRVHLAVDPGQITTFKATNPPKPGDPAKVGQDWYITVRVEGLEDVHHET